MAQSAPPGWTSGCEHYNRICKIIAPCCNEVFSCRFCHDAVKNHSLNRFDVTTIICTLCATKQPAARKCVHCNNSFGVYVCLICNLFDNEDKKQFHCQECGICRIGGRDNFFHCEKCDLCYSLELFNNHTCIEKASRRNCPICTEDLHTSRVAAHVPLCGHLLHKTCFEQVKMYKTCNVCNMPY